MKENKKIIPPIKCQGIKSKLVDFIKENIEWDTDGEGIWYEPFLGSGVVLFNVQPKKAIVSDLNEHIINFYKALQNYKITPDNAREFLEYHGKKLEELGESYYYKMRDDFNKNKNELYFLFLTRACFNGLMRFNRKGFFNVPFCKKNNRFSKAYITKICNQIDNVQKIIKGKEWTFIHRDWREAFLNSNNKDFFYLDPPYIGRDTGYVGEWTKKDAEDLAVFSNNSPSKVMLSMWKENKYRSNDHIDKCWSDYKLIYFEHFYHVGATENLRNKITEVLALKI